MHRRRPTHHRRRWTASHLRRPQLRQQHRSRSYLLSIDLSPVHVLHGVLRLVGSRELDVSEAAPQMGVQTVCGKLHVLYLTIVREYLRDVVFGYGPG